MGDRSESDSRRLLRRLRDVLSMPVKGQERLDRAIPVTSVDMINHAQVTDKAVGSTLTVEQLIANEEASGDPELVAIAARRRQWAGISPQNGECAA